MSKEVKFAPREIFEQILEYAVIPTFDLVIEDPEGKVIIVKRKIAPYKNTWALPGLRMFKPESIDDTISRIAKAELGLDIDPKRGVFLGQYVGRFKTEHQRQDLSTGYLIPVDSFDQLNINPQHFSSYRLISGSDEIPKNIGAMYKFYLEERFKSRA